MINTKSEEALQLHNFAARQALATTLEALYIALCNIPLDVYCREQLKRATDIATKTLEIGNVK